MAQEGATSDKTAFADMAQQLKDAGETIRALRAGMSASQVAHGKQASVAAKQPWYAVAGGAPSPSRLLPCRLPPPGSAASSALAPRLVPQVAALEDEVREMGAANRALQENMVAAAAAHDTQVSLGCDDRGRSRRKACVARLDFIPGLSM